MSKEKLFKPGITWTDLTSKNFSMRMLPMDCLFDMSGPAILFEDKKKIDLYIGFFNSSVCDYLLKLFNPSFHVKLNDIKRVPVKLPSDEEVIVRLSKENITISKQDWDAHETSWDFQENELVRVFKEGKAKDLQATVSAYKKEWEEKFNQLHDNEVELNRQFIEIYGLQDELSPDVPLEEVTILQQGEISIEDK